ncbi:MAG: hypothetical protein M1826_005750 [Phylliscum demangeonii]|nr:MAG: hypothetical protein M1826_005750 [Phylliscum demangeonii]
MSPLPPPPPYSPSDIHTSAQPQRPPPPSAGAARPSHDYTTYDQSGAPGRGVEVDVPWVPAPAPPHSTRLQCERIEATASTVTLSSTLYCASRPAVIRPASRLLRHPLMIPHDAQAHQVPYPQPEGDWLRRDITMADWSTFVNHLVLPPADGSGHDTTAFHRPPRRSSSSTIDKVAVVRKPLPAELQRQETKRATGDAESEDERRHRIETAVALWNAAFFRPRGVEMDEVIAPYSSALVADAPPSVRLPPPRTTAATQAAAPTKTRGWKSMFGVAASKTSLTESATGSRPSTHGKTSDGIVSTVPPSTDDLAVPLSTPAAARPPPKRQSSEGSRLTPTMSTTSSTGSRSSADSDLQATEIHELRTAFAQFVLASRTRQEASSALTDLADELQAQRLQTVKELKAEMKVRRKEMKALTRQHKEDQRRERQQLKLASKSRKQDVKTLQRERKDLVKREVEARKEVRSLKKMRRKKSVPKALTALMSQTNETGVTG